MSSEQIHIQTSWRSLNKDQEELCGDRVQIRRSDDGLVLVLADGLGSGVIANVLSTLTSTIISEMLYGGLSLQDCVETIASTLPVDRERGIAYSTFSIIQIRYSGETTIAQFDSPAVLILRNGHLLHLHEDVLTLSGKQVHLMKMHARPGDVFITFSDGIVHAGLGMVLNLGWGEPQIAEFMETKVRPEDSARDITRLLLANVNYLYGGRPGDDSTVACLRVIKARETRVMVGPPLHKEDDEKIVGQLMQASGYKICCGGTTSEVVARVLERELKVDTDLSHAGGLPPKGYIQGIDLVTEGVLTLQRVQHLLRKAAQDPDFEEELSHNREEDGASCLCRLLLNSSGIRFLVGQSDNPAHEAIRYSPISLSAKISLIREMAESLRQMGRIVRIQMN